MRTSEKKEPAKSYKRTPTLVQERRKFYFQEFFSGFNSLRKYFLLILLLIEVEEIIKIAILPPTEGNTLHSSTWFAIHGFVLVAILIYAIIYERRSQRKRRRSLHRQISMLIIANIV